MNVFESRQKPCVYCLSGTIHLEAFNDKYVIEIRKDSVIIARIEFPFTSSGYSYAKRVFNGLQ